MRHEWRSYMIIFQMEGLDHDPKDVIKWLEGHGLDCKVDGMAIFESFGEEKDSRIKLVYGGRKKSDKRRVQEWVRAFEAFINKRIFRMKEFKDLVSRSTAVGDHLKKEEE